MHSNEDAKDRINLGLGHVGKPGEDGAETATALMRNEL